MSTLDVERTREVVVPARRGPWCVEVVGEGDPVRFDLGAGEVRSLGSGPRADVQVPDPTVSAVHCWVRSTPSGVEVRDAGSRNGVYVGEARVDRAVLGAGASAFVIGRTPVVVRAGSTAAEPAPRVPGLVGESDAIRRVAHEVARHARHRAPVLIQGESGTGKDVVARALHDLGRRGAPYVPLNVGALPETLADSELFGHHRGAFTGAVMARAGVFEQAHRGTLFLDEIADLPLALQARLLRVVEDGVVRPLGGARSVSVDVRIVSATWAPLDRRVDEGAFRADLFHRLSTVVIRLPPLRERRSDLPLLAATLLARRREELGPRHLSPDAVEELARHSWPGNVRELGAVLYRAALSAPGVCLDALQVRAALAVGWASSAPRVPADARRLLELHGGNVSAAARAANVPRSTFRSWLAASRAGE
ncbi:MAG: sigma 54-interacting transcriptional regulator [Polyangiaceae bacterium]|nr:sigma 54-interacting transcriptional regulator [Polyangiaceae bacterium]